MVIGGGIAGLTAAYCIAKSGLQVALLEDGCLGSGESGRTTAQITYALDDRYYDLEKFFGKENAALAAESHWKALEWIRETVNSENIDCHFMDVDGYLCTHPTDAESNLDKELEATQRVGLPTEMTDQVTGLPSGLKRRALRFPDQGQFHIMKFLKGLAEAIVRMGGEIYTGTHADAISGKGAKANGQHNNGQPYCGGNQHACK